MTALWRRLRQRFLEFAKLPLHYQIALETKLLREAFSCLRLAREPGPYRGPTLEWEVLSEAPADYVVYAAGHGAYVVRDGLPLLRSALVNLDRGHLHLHVMAEDTTALEKLREVVKGASPEIGVSLSWDLEPLPQEKTDRGFVVTSRRLAMLYSVLRHLDLPLLMLDLDCLIRRDLADAIEAARADDAQLRLRLHRGELQRKIIAAGVFVNNSESGLRFADLLHRMAVRSLKTIPPHHLDQVLLLLAYRYARWLAPTIRLGELDADWVDETFHDRAFVWHGKADRKRQDDVYRAERQEFQQ